MLSIKSLLPPCKRFVPDPIAPLGIRPIDGTKTRSIYIAGNPLDTLDLTNELDWMKQNLPTHPLIAKSAPATMPAPVAVPGTLPSSPNISSIPVVEPTPIRARTSAEQFEVEDVDDVADYPPEPYDQEFIDDDFEPSPASRF